jgi:hypothetical protein
MSLPHHEGDRVQPDPEAEPSPRPSGTLRKLATGAVGGTVTAAGVVMLVTPGPGVLVAFAGMAILAREFPAVRSRLDRWRTMASSRLNKPH